MTRLVLTLTVLALALPGGAAATRVLHQPEDAYEVALGEVRLPRQAGDTISFTPCPRCQPVALRVTTATRYFVQGQPVALADLATLTAGLTRAACVGVFFDKTTRSVNRVSID